jgi:hypothetical protein
LGRGAQERNRSDRESDDEVVEHGCHEARARSCQLVGDVYVFGRLDADLIEVHGPV